MILCELHDKTNALVQRLSGATKAAYHPMLNSDGSGMFQIHRADPDVAKFGILTGGIDGYIVHLLRKGPLEQTFTDRFSFVVESLNLVVGEQEDEGAWIRVAGRGTLCLLEDRMAYPPGYDGVNQSTVTNQWQIYTATPGGAIMGGEINRSNGRFALQLTHSVDTSSVPQTVTLRFDNLRKLHDYLVGNGMDAQMVGLDYQAADNLGSDRSASVTVQMAAQDSLLGVTLERDARPVKNYVVAQGTGEGINALLRSSSDAPSIVAFRRREGFIDASQDADATQLALRASSAVKQLKAADQRITVRFIDSTHTQLYRDFGLGDTVSLVVPPVSWSSKYRVVGFSIADTDGEVEEISLDLNSMRQEYLLKLATGAQLSADQLNTIARMPQGAPFNDSIGYPREADPTHPFRFKFFVPSNVLKLNYAKLSIGLEAFRSPVAGAATVTSAAGSNHTHTTPAHAHRLFAYVNSTGMGATAHEYDVMDSGGTPVHMDLLTPSNLDLYTYSTSGSATSGAEGAHTHQVTPSLTYGIFEGAVATGVSVKVNATDRTSALGGPFSADQAELTLDVAWLTIGAWNTVELTPTGLGTIIGHLRLTGYQQSA